MTATLKPLPPRTLLPLRETPARACQTCRRELPRRSQGHCLRLCAVVARYPLPAGFPRRFGSDFMQREIQLTSHNGG